MNKRPLWWKRFISFQLWIEIRHICPIRSQGSDPGREPASFFCTISQGGNWHQWQRWGRHLSSTHRHRAADFSTTDRAFRAGTLVSLWGGSVRFIFHLQQFKATVQSVAQTMKREEYVMWPESGPDRQLSLTHPFRSVLCYSQHGDDVASLDLIVPDTPAVQEDDVTVPSAVWIQEGLHRKQQGWWMTDGW